MRALVLAGAVLAGCGAADQPPEVRACEAFVRGTLTTPGAYERLSVSTTDQPSGRRIGSLAIGTRTVALTYSVPGTPNQTRQCTFETLNGRVADAATNDLAIRVALDRHRLWRERAARSASDPQPGCCTS